MKRSVVVNVAKYLIAIALLAFVISMNWTGLKNLNWPPNFEYFFLAALIFVAVTGLQYFRWFLLVRSLDLPFTPMNALRLGLVGTFYNSFLPGSVGGDFVKAFFIAKGQPSRRAAAVATVIADRLVGLFGLILFAGVLGGIFWLNGNEKIVGSASLQTIIKVCLVLLSLAVIAYMGMGLLSQARADRFAHRLHGMKRVGGTLAELWYTIWTYRQKPRTVLAVVAISAVVHTGFVLMYHLAVRVFPPNDLSLLGTLPEHFVISPIGFIVQALIPLPGGIGGGELTFGGLYILIRGREGEAVGLAGRLALRLIEWTVGLVGYIAYLRMKDELPIQAAEKAAEQDDPFPETDPVATVP